MREGAPVNPQSALIMSDPFSAIMMVGALVLPTVTVTVTVKITVTVRVTGYIVHGT